MLHPPTRGIMAGRLLLARRPVLMQVSRSRQALRVQLQLARAHAQLSVLFHQYHSCPSADAVSGCTGCSQASRTCTSQQSTRWSQEAWSGQVEELQEACKQEAQLARPGAATAADLPAARSACTGPKGRAGAALGAQRIAGSSPAQPACRAKAQPVSCLRAPDKGCPAQSAGALSVPTGARRATITRLQRAFRAQAGRCATLPQKHRCGGGPAEQGLACLQAAFWPLPTC